MNDRERIETLLRRDKPDRVPIWPFAAAGFSAVHSGLSISDAYNKPEKALEAQRKACRDFGWVLVPMFGYAAIGGWEFGGKIKWPEGEFDQAPTISKQSVESEEDALNLQMPDYKNSGIVPLMMEFSKMSTRENPDNEPFSTYTLGVCVSFTLACNICGPEKFLRQTIKKPDIAHRLLRLATDYVVNVAQYWKDIFGLERVLPMGGEPTASNQMISPKTFEQFALPYIKESHERVLGMGYKHLYCHICGEQNDNLPFWIQVPFGDPGIISIGHEISLETAAKHFPDEIILGNLDTTIVQMGTPDEIYEATRKTVVEGKNLANGYIFSPGCDLPPMASTEQVMAMTHAVNDHGWYN